MERQVCTKCLNELPLTTDYFFKRKNASESFFKTCRKCMNENRKAWGYKNKNKLAENKKKWDVNNPEKRSINSKRFRENNKEKIKRKKREFYLLNKEAISKKTKAYWELHKEHLDIKKKEYHQNNKDKARILRQKRRARLKSLDRFYTVTQWEETKEYFHNLCAYCGSSLELVQDHFVPVSKGGEYTTNNIIPSCISCNSSKNNKWFSDWYPTYKHFNKNRERKILNFLGYKDGVQQLRII